MTHFFKHTAFRIWATLLPGGFLCIWVLPELQPYIGLELLLLPAFAILTGVSVIIGWLSNRYGLRQAARLTDEATIWERAGKHEDAEKAFLRAVAIYNSFLMSPGNRKKSSLPLIAQMARFYLARAGKNIDSEAFIISYLELKPEDTEVAENWLQQIEAKESDKKYHDLADRIGDALPENVRIQQLLARFYLSALRTDFAALQTYRRVLAAGGNIADDTIRGLAVVFIREGRADEWALEIYLKAFHLSFNNAQILKGIAACSAWTPKTEKTIPMLDEAFRLLNGIDKAGLEKMRTGFKPPILEQPLEKEIRLASKALNVVRSLTIRIAKAALYGVKFIIPRSANAVRNCIGFFRASRGVRVILKWSLAGMLAVSVIFLVVNTVDHLVKTGDSGFRKTGAVEKVVTDTFTLQVAAYVKPEHADRYVTLLKKQGIDAYWSEAVGKKKKWYQVRVSHFADKKSARAYGESLKAKGIIDDFYVANY